ncbi:hypothetical protein LG201_03610 [Methylobacillus gramineus]|nr:hypothetical protein [Methylobacillus gramineus]
MAPTRMTDGAWLFGFLKRWQDVRYAPLCKIYLNIVGEGNEYRNQVVQYQRLLDDNECRDWRTLDDQYYMQGVIRLALGQNVEQYLPEIIGFNLGYQQVSLAMLVAAYELNEMNIKSHYFTLGATTEDACSASAVKMLQPLLADAPSLAARQALLARVASGYQLHKVGMDIPAMVENFDLQKEFLCLMQPRMHALKRIHRIDCLERGILPKWLSHPSAPALMMQLYEEGWTDTGDVAMVQRSGLWLTMQRENILPQGYELQVLIDWLGQSKDYAKRLSHLSADCLRAINHQASSLIEGIYDPVQKEIMGQQGGDALDRMNESSSQDDIMNLLIRLIAPLMHHTQEGLRAARIYQSVLEKGSQLYSQHHAFFLMRDVV